MFAQVMENLESLRMLLFHFLGLESHEIEMWVMESHEKANDILSENRKAKRSKVEN